MKEHGSLEEVVKFIRSKMAEKEAENAKAAALAAEDESEPESEDGAADFVVNSDGEEVPAPKRSPVKKKPKKKGTSAGMQIPEYWPWEEAKKLFITPDVTKGDDLDVGAETPLWLTHQIDWKAPDEEGLVEFLVREKGFK